MEITDLILLLLVLVSAFSIFMNYQTGLTDKTFIIMTYLYVAFTLLLSIYSAKLIINNNLEHNFYSSGALLFALFIGCIAIFLQKSNDNTINHIGLAVFVLFFAITLSVVFSISSPTNLMYAGLMTLGISLLLATVIYLSPINKLKEMHSWKPLLFFLLLILIVVDIGSIYAYPNMGQLRRLIDMSVVVVFIFFVLSDTSTLLLKAGDLNCNSHLCINYPKTSSNLVLNYVNIFARLTNRG
jgi:hypothetical protein